MNSNTLNQMAQMKLHGMLRSYQALLETNQHPNLTNDELIAMLTQAEWEEREQRKINRFIKTAASVTRQV